MNVHDGNGSLSETLCEIELELKQPMTTAIIEGIEQKGVAGNDLATLLFHEEVVGLVLSTLGCTCACFCLREFYAFTYVCAMPVVF